MVIALIFAGGTGSRMNSNVPKQFLKIKNKPILAYTIEKFNNHKTVDKIILVTNKEYFDETLKIVNKYKFSKVISVIPGGSTAIESQYLGLLECKKIFNSNCLVLLHDGVRPFVNKKTIDECIEIS